MSGTGTSLSQRRLLVLAPEVQGIGDAISISPLPVLLEAITGSKPSSEITTFSGYTSHPPLHLKNKYYETDVSIWCDELPPPAVVANTTGTIETAKSALLESEKGTTASSQDEIDTTKSATLNDWKDQMLSSAAAEVRAAIGGLVLALPFTASSAVVNLAETYVPLVVALSDLREMIEDDSYGRETAAVVVLQSVGVKTVSQADLDKAMEVLEDRFLNVKGDLGVDFVVWDGDVAHARDESEKKKRNAFGERTGNARVLEVLEGLNWGPDPADEDNFFAELEQRADFLADDADEVDEADILGHKRYGGLDDELQREMMGLKLSMMEQDSSSDKDIDPLAEEDAEGEDVPIDQMHGLMERVVAIREAGADMSKEERETFAKKEIAKIMKEM